MKHNVTDGEIGLEEEQKSKLISLGVLICVCVSVFVGVCALA